MSPPREVGVAFATNGRAGSRRTPKTLSTHPRFSSAGGLIALAFGLHVLAYAMQQTRLSIVALLIFSAGLLETMGGKRARMAGVFPLAFLALAIPVGFLQPLGFYLRLAVSESAEALLSLGKIAVVRNGTQLFAPDGHFQYDVAAACSGVRSLMALFALSLVIGYVRLSRLGNRVLLALATVPFAFAGNFLRILAIVMTGHYFGQRPGEWVHDYSAFLVFAVVLSLLLAVVPVLARREGNPRGRTPVSDSDQAPPSLDQAATTVRPPMLQAWRIPLFTTLLFVAAVAATKGVDRRGIASEAGVRLADNGIDPASLPEFIGTEWIGQRMEVTAPEREVLPPDTGYSRKNYVSIQDRTRQVFVSVVLSGRDRSSIHRPELCLIGQGWNIVERTQRTLRLGAGQELPVTLLRIQRDVTARGGERRSLSCWLAYWFVGREVQVPSHAEMVWQSSVDRLLHFRADRWAYVLAQAPLTAGQSDGLEEMEEVLGAVWPQMRRERGP